jgi:hypothetical protein
MIFLIPRAAWFSRDAGAAVRDDK